MTQRYLQGSKLYLSGPIQFDTSNLDWRVKPKQVLSEEFGITLFDPFSDPKQQKTPIIQEAIQKRDYATLTKTARDFVRKDLGVIDRSDFVIAFLPHKVPTYGTTHEVILSNSLKKPTLLVTDTEDIAYIPLWFFGFIKVEFMFASWEALYEYLRKVDRGECQSNNRWDFVYNKV